MDRVRDIFTSIREWWISLSRVRRIVILAILAAILILSLVLVLIFNHVTYVPLYSGASESESAEVFAALRDLGVEPRISNVGVISVPEESVAQVKMQLAMNGFGGVTSDYPNYTSSPLTSTQSERDQLLLIDLGLRVQESIASFPEVESSIVTFNVPRPSIYALDDDTLPPTASVKITEREDMHLDSSQVLGILNIVKMHVPGLIDENIAIVNNEGDMKYVLDELDGSTGDSKLLLSEKVNNIVRTRVLRMLSPAYGAENLEVAVNSVLDTDAKTSIRREYQPFDENNPRNNPLDYSRVLRERVGGDGDVIQGVPGANDNVDVPEYMAEDLPLEGADSYAFEDEFDYLVNSVQEEVTSKGLNITSMSIAVVINDRVFTEDQRDRVIDLTMQASGVPIEAVSVQSLPFIQREGTVGVLEPPELDWFTIMWISILAFVALLILLLIIILTVRKKQKEKAEAEAAALAAQEEFDEDALLDLMGEDEEGFQPIVIPETAEQKLRAQIRDLAVSDPEIVAQLIKTWLVASN
jgi:flagellar M-ring protein FliF